MSDKQRMANIVRNVDKIYKSATRLDAMTPDPDGGPVTVKAFVWYLEGQPDDYVFNPFIDHIRMRDGNVNVLRSFAEWHTLYEKFITPAPAKPLEK